MSGCSAHRTAWPTAGVPPNLAGLNQPPGVVNMPDGKNVGVNTGVRMGTVADHLRLSQLASNRGIPPASRPFPDAVRRDAGEHYVWNDLASKPRGMTRQ